MNRFDDPLISSDLPSGGNPDDYGDWFRCHQCGEWITEYPCRYCGEEEMK